MRFVNEGCLYFVVNGLKGYLLFLFNRLIFDKYEDV